MARRLPPLKAIPAFEAAARHLSFERAGQELAVTAGGIPTGCCGPTRELEGLSPLPGFAAAGPGLAHDFARVLVLAKALVGGVPKQAVARPAPQLDLGHELRLDPTHAPDRISGKLIRERRGRPFEPLQLIAQTARHRVLEAS